MGVSIVSVVAPAVLAKAVPESRPLADRSSGAEKETRRRLFDGKSLRGWSGDSGQWVVRDGAIVGRPATNRAAVLASDDRFGTFRMTFSARIPSGGDGALCVWGLRPTQGGGSPCRGVAFTFPTAGGWNGRSGTSLIWKSVHASPVKDPAAWIDFEILADVRTGHVRIAENGVEVLDYVDPEPARLTAGPLSFQLAEAAGPPREIEIKDVLADAAPRTGVLLTVNLCGVQSPAGK